MKYDYVIIGSGPAGSTLSQKLANKGFKIAIVDRAIHEDKRIINDFFCPYINKIPEFYTPIYSDQLGGNSALWHGKVYLISKKEFAKSDWGFEFEELKNYSDDLAHYLNIKPDLLTKIKIKNKNNYHYSYRSNLKNIFKTLKIKNSKNIDIYKGHSPIKLNFISGKAVSIDISNKLNQVKTLDINNSLVFCAGGIGNPHLLLNLLPINNNHVGKYLSDHAHVNLGKVKHTDVNKFLHILKPNIKNNLAIGEINKEEEMALIYEYEDFFAGIQLDYKVDPLRKLRRIFLKINNLFLRKVLNLFGFFVTKLNGLKAKTGILFDKYYKYSFEFYFSQHTTIKNCVSLDQNKYDEFGLKKVNINWDLTEIDKSKIQNIIKDTIGPDGLIIKNQNINFSESFYKHGLAGLHPSCTTRISTSEQQGVVDPNLKVYNYDNIYICGSSILPNNGFTNPTWTIMTLANRLSNFLIKK